LFAIWDVVYRWECTAAENGKSLPFKHPHRSTGRPIHAPAKVRVVVSMGFPGSGAAILAATACKSRPKSRDEKKEEDWELDGG